MRDANNLLINEGIPSDFPKIQLVTKEPCVYLDGLLHWVRTHLDPVANE